MKLAILTADMEGFSRQMRSDESTVITLLLGTYYRRAQQASDRFGGRLFRREGDAIWCSFPQPQQALDAGLWLLTQLAGHNRGQAESNQIRLRVAVTWGEVEYAGDVPTGAPLTLARKLESGGRVGSIQVPLDLLASVSLDGEVERGESTAFVRPRETLVHEDPKNWMLALDLTETAPGEQQDWLSWALGAVRRQRAQVYEGQDKQYVVIWPGRLPLNRLPCVLPARSRATLGFGPVGSDPGLASDSVLGLLEAAPRCPGMWGYLPDWEWQHQGEFEGQPLFYAGPEPEQAFQLQTSAFPDTSDTRLEKLARACVHRQAACVLVGPWGESEEVEALREEVGSAWPDLWEDPRAREAALRYVEQHFGRERTQWLQSLEAPIYTWFDDPRLGASKRLVGSPEAAWAALSDKPRLRRGELLWICPPHSQEWLKLLFADYDFRFENARPGILLHPGWDEREERRWRRRGFEWIEDSPAVWDSLRQLIRFHGHMRYERRRLAPLPSRPYKFLNYYTREDRSIFFGREAEIERLRPLLFASGLLVVFGKSGVGKTSLLRAGLLSQFQPPHDLVVSMRMLSDPVASLRSLWCRTLGLEPGQQSLAELLAVAEQRVDGRVVLVLDQFEEFFLRCSPPQREQFGRELAAVQALDLRRTHLILSLREDFLAQMSELETFVPSILKGRFRVSALGREQALEAMLKPARLFGFDIAPAVVEDLMQQLDRGGIEPPQLQIVLDRLYDQRQNQQVSWEIYQSLGGAQQLLQSYFEQALHHSLGPDTRRARQLLKQMITVRRTKLVVTQEELQQSTGWPPENLSAVLKLLVDSRLVRCWQDEEGRGCYELAHDFLVQEVANWETPEEVALKHAQSVLRTESRHYLKLGMVVPRDRLVLLQPQAGRLSLSLEEQRMLVRSCVLQGLDPTPWMGLSGGPEVLLQILDEEVSGEVTRSVTLRLISGGLSGRALDRTLEAARQAGNPHLLAQLPELPERLREALQRAVQQRFFGPDKMVPVPAGPAWIGSTWMVKEARKANLRTDLHERIDSEPDLHQVDVDGFWIDRLAVSNADYCEFQPLHAHVFPAGEADLPAVNISYEEALQYAAWLGKTLPTEIQWEKAARGTDGRFFPWGHEFDSSRCNSAESGLRELVEVHAHPEGASPYGCVGMVGNAWEWTTTPWEPDSGLMAKKGGCALNYEPLIHCSSRFEDPPEMRLRWAGFRLISSGS